MIHIRSMSFGTFAEIEPLNPAFHARQPKMRVTVDTERVPRLAEAAVLSELVGAFPGLARHQCRASAGDGASPAGSTRSSSSRRVRSAGVPCGAVWSPSVRAG